MKQKLGLVKNQIKIKKEGLFSPSSSFQFFQHNSSYQYKFLCSVSPNLHPKAIPDDALRAFLSVHLAWRSQRLPKYQRHQPQDGFFHSF